MALINEIDCKVEELLANGIIWRSKFSYNPPIWIVNIKTERSIEWLSIIANLIRLQSPINTLYLRLLKETFKEWVSPDSTS